MHEDMKFLRQVVGHPDDQENRALLQAAHAYVMNRVVVKRPNRARPLGCFKPHETLQLSSHRFDLYFANRKLQSDDERVDELSENHD